jgi:hypothetical protein
MEISQNSSDQNDKMPSVHLPSSSSSDPSQTDGRSGFDLMDVDGVDSGEETETLESCDCDFTDSTKFPYAWERRLFPLVSRWKWLKCELHEINERIASCDRDIEHLRKNKLARRRNNFDVAGHISNEEWKSIHPLFRSKNRITKRLPGDKKKARPQKPESELLLSKEEAPGIEEEVAVNPPVAPKQKKEKKISRGEHFDAIPTPDRGKKLSQSENPLTFRKRKYESSQYDIDNVVLPFNFSFPSVNIPSQIEKVEISTPTWRLIEPLPPTLPDKKRPSKKRKQKDRPLPVPEQIATEPPPPKASSDEDTSDDAFYKRHRPKEILERKAAGLPIEENLMTNFRRHSVAQNTSSSDKILISTSFSGENIQDTFLVTSGVFDPGGEDWDALEDSSKPEEPASDPDELERTFETQREIMQLNWEVSIESKMDDRIMLRFRALVGKASLPTEHPELES